MTLSTIVIVLFLSGVALFAYAVWSRPIADGDAALAIDRLDEARLAYETAEARFDRTPTARALFPDEYAHIVSGHLMVLYRLKHYDDAVDLADRAPAASAPHFWSGCAFFEKGAVEEKPDARLGWFSRAEDEFHKALDAAPDDWNTKYDFELTSRLAAELRKQPKTPPKQLMQLLRPQNNATKATRKVG
ncbi:MAG TPA: hypothetical protein VGL62_01410 [Vicinamibacterales bacterium]